jgi:hypothetical protein
MNNYITIEFKHKYYLFYKNKTEQMNFKTI